VALAVARRDLRAATDLARLRHAAYDPCALLEPILGTIEGGETTPDVRNARALLAALGIPGGS
jgi:hypothetical protein